MRPSLRLEKKYWQQGFKYIAGLDEVGRGALAGPIMAAAVIFETKKTKIDSTLKEVKDSKLLSPNKREKLFKLIIKNCLCWTTAKVSEKIIDKIGINQANELVFKKAIEKLKIRPKFIFVDGRKKLESFKIPSQAMVKADRKIFSVAAASILAKVTRDNLMRKLAKKFPKYRFEKHKGYGTKEHYRLLRKYRPCSCHRRSFRLQ